MKRTASKAEFKGSCVGALRGQRDADKSNSVEDFQSLDLESIALTSCKGLQQNLIQARDHALTLVLTEKAALNALGILHNGP